MGSSVSKKHTTGAQRGYGHGAARNEVQERKKKEENVSNATVDDERRGDKISSQKTNESDKAAGQYLGSDVETHDSTSQAVEHIDDTIMDQKRLFKGGILSVSSDVLECKCTRCDEYVECSYCLFPFNDSCIVFTETTCRHEELACHTIELENKVRFYNKTRVFIEPWPDSVFCILSGEIYSLDLSNSSVYRCSIESVTGRKNLTREISFTASDTCIFIAGFNHGFALLIKVYGVSVKLQIQYVDASGKVQRFVYKKPNGDYLFNNPTSLVSNYAGNILYVIDGETILVLDVNAVLLKCIEFETTPTCVTTDSENNIHVACGKDLIQLNDQFERRVLLKGDITSAEIEAVAWINSAGGLAVISDSRIFLYKLLP